jgi:hypothetical protein
MISVEKSDRLTSHWQNGGFTAKLNVSAHLAAECVSHSAFLTNLDSVKTHRLRYC